MKQFKFQGTFLLIIVLSIIGCDSKQASTEIEPEVSATTATSKTEIAEFPELGSLYGDTINLHGKFVVFYGPEKSNETKDAEILAFQSTSKSIIDSLKQNAGIFTVYTSVNSLRIYNSQTGTPMVILRSSFSEQTGVILTDGMQSPIIKKGFSDAGEIHVLISKMFRNPS